MCHVMVWTVSYSQAPIPPPRDIHEEEGCCETRWMSGAIQITPSLSNEPQSLERSHVSFQSCLGKRERTGFMWADAAEFQFPTLAVVLCLSGFYVWRVTL